MRRASSDGNNLESLQLNSWQLELLVTGFALAGMLSGYEEFTNWTDKWLSLLSNNDLSASLAEGLIVCVSFAYLITLTNFFIHIVLRCLWIGAIGSRSVMGTTTLARRRLAPIFQRFLHRRSGDFDAYIQRIDDAASLVFAFTFLLLAVALSIVMATLFISGVVLAFRHQFEQGSKRWILILSMAMLLYLLFSLIYFLDFISSGFFKRFRLFSYLYYPFYRLFGWITLARIYRPLYYNLLSHRGGRWLTLLLVPYLLLVALMLTVVVTPYQYVSDVYFGRKENSRYVLNASYYRDQISTPSYDALLEIPSQVIVRSPLRVRIPLQSTYADYTERRCPDLVRHYESTLNTPIFGAPWVSGGAGVNGPVNVLSAATMKCIHSAVGIYLDDRAVSLDDAFLSKRESTPRPDLIKFIPLDTLPPGIHYLTLKQWRVPGEGAAADTALAELTVPFYYAPD